MGDTRYHITTASIAVGVTSLMWLWLLPFSTIPWLATYLAVATGVIALYKRYFSSRVGETLLAAVAMVLISGVAVNVAQFCPTSNFAAPTLINYDSFRLYEAASQLYRGEEISVIMRYQGIPALVAALWHVTGITIFVPLLLSVALTLSAVALTAGIARHIVGKGETLAMGLCAACCYFSGLGTLILKEPYVSFAVALAVYSIASRKLWGLAIAVVILATVRDGILYYLMLALPLFLGRKGWKPIVLSMAIVLCGILLGDFSSTSGNDLYFTGMDGTRTFEKEFNENPNHAAYNELFAGYYTLPVWKRMLLLPITAGIQFLIPFPFDLTKYWDFGYTQSLCQMAYPWYIMGGTLLYFIFKMLLKPHREPLWRWGVLAIISYLAPAYLFGGSVSRYWVTFMPLYATLIAATLLRLKSDNRKPFVIFYACYAVLLAVALVTALILQS